MPVKTVELEDGDHVVVGSTGISDPIAPSLERIEYVRALDVPADAVLAVKSKVRLNAEQAAAVSEQVKAVLPGRKVLVLPPEFDLVVVRDEPETKAASE